MRRIKLTVAYDGTNYCGWQVQPNGITIEEVLNKKLSALTKEDIRVIGASRTDSGVHALGNVAVFDTESTIPPERMALALNQKLPEDIVIVKSQEVPLSWHPRYQDNITKTYDGQSHEKAHQHLCVRAPGCGEDEEGRSLSRGRA